MRKEMNLFANLRPAKVLPQLLDASTLKREIVEGVDIMVVRELTGDVYFGTPKGIDVDENGQRVGYNNMIYSEGEIDRIARVAGKETVCLVWCYCCVCVCACVHVCSLSCTITALASDRCYVPSFAVDLSFVALDTFSEGS